MPPETAEPTKELASRPVQPSMPTTYAVSRNLPTARVGRLGRTPALVMVAIGLAVTVAAAGLAWGAADGVDSGTVPLTPTTPAVGSIVLNGPGDIAVVPVVYQPGQTSGWHAHAGIHAVAVLTGELTVYDRDCVAQRFGPGQPYIGGQELHLVRNETASPVDLVVTYLNPASSSIADVRPSTPPNCADQ